LRAFGNLVGLWGLEILLRGERRVAIKRRTKLSKPFHPTSNFHIALHVTAL
jgi:hypothetical protein